jgi:DNA ligase 1
MGKILKPMKGDDFVESELRFPYFGSYKLDGYRAFHEGGNILTSSANPVTNDYTQDLYQNRTLAGRPFFDFTGLDGELVVGAWNDPRAFHNTSGPVRRKSGEPDVRWYIFDDRTSPGDAFLHRSQKACGRVEELHDSGFKRIEYLQQQWLRDLQDMLEFERQAIAMKFEGIMLRDPNGRYKFGRSTVKENLLLKVKRFINEEARITGFKEQMENMNDAVQDNFGNAKRSENKDMMVGTGMVGAFTVESDLWPRPFEISATSLTHEERRHAFNNFESEYKGQLARFKYFPHGVVEVPRHGMFESIRDPNDL